MKLNNPIKSVIPSSIPSLQAACLLIGMGVSLIPVLPRTFPFWGGSYLWSDRGHEHILVTGVVPRSPANAAGLLRGDELLTADGQEVVNFLDWTPMIERLEPGQPMVVEVIRDGQTLLLTARGQQPQLAGIIYFDWQYPFAVGYGIEWHFHEGSSAT